MDCSHRHSCGKRLKDLTAYLTKALAAQYLGISARTLDYLLSGGRIKYAVLPARPGAKNVKRNIRIAIPDLDFFMSTCMA